MLGRPSGRLRARRRPLGHGDGGAGRRAVGGRARWVRCRVVVAARYLAPRAGRCTAGRPEHPGTPGHAASARRRGGALDRLREVTLPPQVDDVDVAQAYLAMAHVAWVAGDAAEAIADAEAATALIEGGQVMFPQARVLFRVVAAVVHLRSTGRPGVDDAAPSPAPSSCSHWHARRRTPSPTCPWSARTRSARRSSPPIADEPAVARELWAIGMRLAPTSPCCSSSGSASGLEEVLADTGRRDAELERMAWPARPPEAADRIRALTTDLV